MDAMNSALGIEERLVAKATAMKMPLGGSLELLPLCNMNCDMCYVRLSKKEMEAKGRLRSAKEWLELAGEMKAQGVLFLLLTGGEPLLYPEFKKVYLGLLDMGMIVTINTNGTLIDEEWAHFFADHKPRRINITLYGKNKETYRRLCHYEEGFKRTIHGINLLRKHNVDVKLNGSLTKANKDDLEELLQIANELDVPINIDTYMYPAARERECGFHDEVRLTAEEAAEAMVKIKKLSLSKAEFEEYRSIKLQMGNQASPETADCSVKCRAGRSSFVVNWQGMMMPCIMLKNPSINVFETGFQKAWDYLLGEVEKIKISSQCAVCKRRDVCNTCAACAFLETGDYGKVSQYMCDYTEGIMKGLENGRGYKQ